jgi:HD-like signal output (HDOD) protein
MTMDHALVTPDAPSVGPPAARDFLAQLQRELAADQIELPAFPNVSLQLQRLLMDDNVGNDKVIRLVGVEPVLAGRIMQLANSAALNPRGTPIVELRSAIARLGFNALRAAAVSFAVTQLRLAPAYQNIQQSLALLWNDSVTMASTACVVARRSRRISPDSALFAGLVSGVGKICLLARTSDQPALASEVSVYHQIVRDWHADVTRALLRHWHVADEIVASVHDFQRHAESQPISQVLTDVLTVAELLAFDSSVPEQVMQNLSQSPSARRLGLDPQTCLDVLSESQDELELLRIALGQHPVPAPLSPAANSPRSTPALRR